MEYSHISIFEKMNFTKEVDIDEIDSWGFYGDQVGDWPTIGHEATVQWDTNEWVISINGMGYGYIGLYDIIWNIL